MPRVPRLRQLDTLEEIVARAEAIPAIEGVIVLGSFASGQPDALSDLDLVVAAAPDSLDEAWEARFDLAGDAFLIWEPQSNEGRNIRWLNWLTHDLVKVECGIAAPGSTELADPFKVVHGPPNLASRFPRISLELIAERRRQRDEEQRVFDPDTMTAEERLGWKLAEMKTAARALVRR